MAKENINDIKHTKKLVRKEKQNSKPWARITATDVCDPTGCFGLGLAGLMRRPMPKNEDTK